MRLIKPLAQGLAHSMHAANRTFLFTVQRAQQPLQGQRLGWVLLQGEEAERRGAGEEEEIQATVSATITTI